MTQLQSEFPIFKNNPGLIYLDSASTTQKPQMVIDAQKHFLEHSYANIHRGKYELSQRSDELYFETKKRLDQFIHANSPFEICFTANATSASNLLVGSLLESKYFVPGDEILINIQEHHASIVPWQIAAKKCGLILKYIPYDSEYQCDIQALQSSLNPKTRAFIGSRVSNVTGSILDFEKVRSIVGPDVLCIGDYSQGLVHANTDVGPLDFIYATAHKAYADTGIGFLWGKMEHLKRLSPAIGGGGAINWVTETDFEFGGIPNRFEPGTPHISGAVSFGAALSWIESIGGIKILLDHEDELILRALEYCKNLPPNVELLGSKKLEFRRGVFSFLVSFGNVTDIAEALAQKNICIRAGHHCAEPLIRSVGANGSIRMSIGASTIPEDIDRFFEEFFELANHPEKLLEIL